MKTTMKAKTAPTHNQKTTDNAIYSIKINSINGEPIDLSSYKDRHILFVNVASKCGFTNQYKDLQKLNDTYPETLVIIGCPCNQFGMQEPADAPEIKAFCEKNYGVTFLLTEKINVRGKNKHPLYQWLTDKALNGKKNSSVKWNFQKYLVDKDGKLVDYYFSSTKPLSKRITKHL